MLKRNRLMCLVFPMFFMIPNTVTPFHNQAEQSIEKQIDLNGMVQVNKFGMIKHPFEIQFEKDREETNKLKKKAEEERLIKERELEQQKKKNKIQWQEFELTFYTSLAEENSGNGTKSVTCTGDRLYDGIVASNYYKLNTKIKLQGWGEVVVGDRGSDKYFNNDYRLDVFIPREQGESDSHYYSRVNKMGKVKTKGIIVNEVK